MSPVDFGVKKKTVASKLEDLAAAPSGAAASPSAATDSSIVSGLTYFRASFPKTTFILGNGQRFHFGDKVPYWHVTDKQEEIDYIRDNFIDAIDTGTVIEECDVHTYNAATTLVQEYFPTRADIEGMKDI